MMRMNPGVRLLMVTISLIPSMVSPAVVTPAASGPDEEIRSLREDVIALKVQLALSKEIDALKAQIAVLQRDIQEIKALLQSRGTPSPAPARMQPAPLPSDFTLTVAGETFLGDPKARMAIVEFIDYQ